MKPPKNRFRKEETHQHPTWIQKNQKTGFCKVEVGTYGFVKWFLVLKGVFKTSLKSSSNASIEGNFLVCLGWSRPYSLSKKKTNLQKSHWWGERVLGETYTNNLQGIGRRCVTDNTDGINLLFPLDNPRKKKLVPRFNRTNFVVQKNKSQGSQNWTVVENL